MGVQDAIRVAEAVRAACIVAAERAYEDGGTSGLCAQGRWELAVGAIRELDLQRILAPSGGDAPHRPHPPMPGPEGAGGA